MKQKLILLFHTMIGYRIKYISAIVAEGFSTGFLFLVPLAIRLAIDSVIGDEPVSGSLLTWLMSHWPQAHALMLQSIGFIAVLIVLFTLLGGSFTYLKGRWAAEASESIARNLRDRLYDHLQRLPFSYHTRAETGDLIQRCTSDVDTIRRFLAMQVVEMGRAMIMLALLIPIMLSLDIRMTLVSLVTVPILLASAYIFFTKVKAAFQRSDEAEGIMSTALQENLTGIRVVRAFARQNFEREKFETHNSSWRDLTYRLIVLLAWYWSVADFIAMAQIGAVLIVGTWWTLDGSLTLGTVVAFVTYESMVVFPVRQLGRILTDLGKTTVSLGRVGEILAEPMETAREAETVQLPERLHGRVEFREVDFGYIEDTPVLNGISFVAEPGAMVAIIGHTGSGKSSLVNLIPRLFEYQSGQILIDDVDLTRIDREVIRRQVGIVLQEPFLYSRSLGENIRLSRHDAAEQDLYQATTLAAVHDTILDFEQGYETLVGERGVTLSGGQKQRVAIARAILQDPPILIFDDSLSAVDTETESHILDAMLRRRGRATTFVIAHRLSTVMQADLILVLEHGRIVQSGSHSDLITEPGTYRRIWELQNAAVPGENGLPTEGN